MARPDGSSEDQRENRSQTDVVVQEIKAMIVDGSLHAGSRLPVENDLAATLGVSRSSLREGVRALALMGVLETRQGDGTYVTSLDASLLLAPMGFVVDLQPGRLGTDIAVVRRVLESEAAARAATRIGRAELAAARTVLAGIEASVEDPKDEDHERILEADVAFHRIIARAAGNAVLEALIEALASRSVRMRLWRAMSERGASAQTHRQHLDILRALESGDQDRTRIAMQVHLLGVEDFAATHDVAPAAEQPARAVLDALSRRGPASA